MKEIPVPILYLQAQQSAAEEALKRAKARGQSRMVESLTRKIFQIKRQIYLRRRKNRYDGK